MTQDTSARSTFRRHKLSTKFSNTFCSNYARKSEIIKIYLTNMCSLSVVVSQLLHKNPPTTKSIDDEVIFRRGTQF